MKFTTFNLTISNDYTCYNFAQHENATGEPMYKQYAVRCDELYDAFHSDEELSTQQRLANMLTCWEEFLTV